MDIVKSVRCGRVCICATIAMAGNLKAKRPATSSQVESFSLDERFITLTIIQTFSKKRKLNNGMHQKKHTKNSKEGKKEKAADRVTIPIPNVNDNEDVLLSDQDLDLLGDFGEAAGFLAKLDRTGIMRSVGHYHLLTAG